MEGRTNDQANTTPAIGSPSKACGSPHASQGKKSHPKSSCLPFHPARTSATSRERSHPHISHRLGARRRATLRPRVKTNRHGSWTKSLRYHDQYAGSLEVFVCAQTPNFQGSLSLSVLNLWAKSAPNCARSRCDAGLLVGPQEDDRAR